MITAVRLIGLDRLEDDLGRLGNEDGFVQAISEAAEQIAEEARGTLGDGAPPESRSGALEASIAVTDGSRSGQKLIGSDLDYGAFLEFGTVRMAAWPWLAPAFERVAATLPARLRRAFGI